MTILAGCGIGVIFTLVVYGIFGMIFQAIWNAVAVPMGALEMSILVVAMGIVFLLFMIFSRSRS